MKPTHTVTLLSIVLEIVWSGI